jgi:hypothetical protein
MEKIQDRIRIPFSDEDTGNSGESIVGINYLSADTVMQIVFHQSAFLFG